jgi:hypothetical protein
MHKLIFRVEKGVMAKFKREGRVEFSKTVDKQCRKHADNSELILHVLSFQALRREC